MEFHSDLVDFAILHSASAQITAQTSYSLQMLFTGSQSKKQHELSYANDYNVLTVIAHSVSREGARQSSATFAHFALTQCGCVSVTTGSRLGSS